MKKTFSSFFLFFLLGISQQLSAQQGNQLSEKKETSQPSENPIEKIDENNYRVGKLILNSKDRTVKLNGILNMEKGIIELLACATGGKVHESVLVLDVVPYHLQVSMLLLGLKYKGGLEYQGDPRTPQGDSVEIWVSWKRDGGDTTVRAEDLVWDANQSKPMEHTSWVFVGSKMVEGRFMADQEKSLITTFHDPFTIFDNPLQGGANDEVYTVNEKLVPRKGTPVTVTIKATE
ncbi:MAG: hypothetical protein HYZ33_04550 [Ignavibacteriales bacterium]|nr:hypothetical protein [Ignavibacteriales bacterium]